MIKYILGYLAIGILTNIYAIGKGAADEITVKDLITFILIAFCWPLIQTFWILEWWEKKAKNIVLWRRKR